MSLNRTHRRARPRWLLSALAVLAMSAVAVGLVSATIPSPLTTTIPAGYFAVTDSDGANDVPAQSDLTQMGRNDLDPDFYKLFWSWDEIDQWTGSGQTGDACALFDSDGDTKINFVVCARVSNTDADPTVVELVPQDATHPVYMFACSDAKDDRCTQPSPVSYDAGQADAGVLGTFAKANLITGTDPFQPVGSDFPYDSSVSVSISKAKLPAGSALVNVCSYPSAGNGGNNNPFDCVVSPGGGFLVIAKEAGAGVTSPTFTFNVTNPTATRQINGTGDTSSSGIAVPIVNNPATSVTEAAAANWTLSSISCKFEDGTTSTGTVDLPNRKVTAVAVQSGKITTCTFTNLPVQPKLTLIKNVLNDSGGTAAATAWTFSTGGTGGFTNAALSTITTEAGFSSSASTGAQTVTAGVAYSLSESATPAGYSASSWVCDSSYGTLTGGAITLALGDDVTCRITNNDVAPKLTLIKNVLNDSGGTAAATAWTFSTGGTGGFTNAALSTITTEAGFSSSASTGAQTVTAGVAYSLSESATPAGYSASSWVCDSSYGTLTGGAITLALGDDVTCRITNNDVAPKLTLIKNVLNDSGGTAAATAWTFSTGGTGGFTNAALSTITTEAGFSSSASTGQQTVTAGVAYSLSESATPAGYSASSWVCDSSYGTLTGGAITLALGDDVTCRITNNDVAPKLTLIKNVLNDSGGTAAATAWTFSTGGTGGFTNAALSTITTEAGFSSSASTGAQTVTAGVAYSLSESATPAGYSASSWVCDSSYGTLTGGAITLALGDDVTCRITNNDVAPKLTLIKNVLNDSGGTAAATAWTFSTGGTGGFTNAALSTITTEAGFSSSASTGQQTVTAGVAYSLSESATPAGYSASSWVCDSSYGTLTGGAITLALGDDVTCRITNNDVAGTLIVKKIVINDNGGTKTAGDFAFSVTGPTASSGTAFDETEATDDGDELTGENVLSVDAGTYTITEDGVPVAGYSTSPSNCTSVTVVNGGTTTCTITNNDTKAQPAGTTVQSWVLHDSIAITGLRAGGGAATVTFRLYDTCTQVASDWVAGDFIDSESMTLAGTSAATVDGIAVQTTGIYFWTVEYSGNQFNDGFTTSCNDEITQILAKDAYGASGRDDFTP